MIKRFIYHAIWLGSFRMDIGLERRIAVEETTKRLVAGLGEVEYGVLRETYCRLKELQTTYSEMYGGFSPGVVPTIDEIRSCHLQLEDITDDLERFLLSLCMDEVCCGSGICEPDH